VIYEHLRICIVSDFKCFNELNMYNEMLISNCKLLNYVGTMHNIDTIDIVNIHIIFNYNELTTYCNLFNVN